MGFSKMSGVQQKTKKQAVKQHKKNNNNKKPKKKRASNGRKNGVARGSLTQSYVQTLCDPWQYAGVPLGWGTMVDTNLGQAYVRGTATSNADGSLAIYALPFINTMTDTTTNNSYSLATRLQAGAAASGGVVSVPVDQAAIQANFGSIRPISIGVRAYPNLALTSVPGQCAVGALPSMDLQTLAALTVTDLVALPSSHLCPGIGGGSATGRPIDVNSFAFSDDYLSVNEADAAVAAEPTAHIPLSVPYVAFTGLGGAISVFFEVVYNFEGTPKMAHGAAPLGTAETQGPRQTLANAWATIENMWNSVKPTLPPSGRPSYNAATVDGDSFMSGVYKGAARFITSNAANIGQVGAGLLTGAYGGRVGRSLLRA
jgi:hypothetical protein